MTTAGNPAEETYETRGGRKPDWSKTKPGGPTPELGDKEPADPGQE
jgi:hypothetical protein